MKLRFYVLCSTVLNDKKKGVCLLHFIQIKSGFYGMNERCYLSQALVFFFFFSWNSKVNSQLQLEEKVTNSNSGEEK